MLGTSYRIQGGKNGLSLNFGFDQVQLGKTHIGTGPADPLVPNLTRSTSVQNVCSAKALMSLFSNSIIFMM